MDTHERREGNIGCLHGDSTEADAAAQTEVGERGTGTTARDSGKAKARAGGSPKRRGGRMERRAYAQDQGREAVRFTCAPVH